MTYRQWTFHCKCGTKAVFYNTFGVTDDGEIFIEWICITCNSKKYCTVTLDEIIRDIPNLPVRPPLQLPTSLFTEEDKTLLHDFRIADEDAAA